MIIHCLKHILDINDDGTMSENYYNNSEFFNLIHNVGQSYFLASRYVNLVREMEKMQVQLIKL